MKALFFLFIYAAVAVLGRAEDGPVFESGPAHVHLVELYTSEGCSSCPPAEEWLSQIRSNAALWKSLVPVAFHVDYWDNLGWPDAYASKSFTDRQYTYSDHWGTSSVYTPGVVLDGSEFRGWRDPNGLANLSPDGAGNLRAVVKGKQIIVSYLPPSAGSNHLRTQIALLGNGIQSVIGSGENGGRTLEHDFVVLAMNGAALTRDPDGKTFRASLSLPERAIKCRHSLAVWVEDPDSGRPIQATGGDVDF